MRLGKISLWQVVVLAAAAVVLAVGGWYYHHIHNRIIWSMIHVSGDSYSGDAHVLEFPNGHVVLIDTGFERFTQRNLVPYLDGRGITRINQLVITHAHRNHYGGIKTLLGHLRGIDAVYFNLPPERPCNRENWSTGCNYQHVLQTRRIIEDGGTSLRGLATGETLYRSDEHDITLEVVYVHDGESPPIGETDINDTSALLRLTYAESTVLFTGDVNRKVGRYLVESDTPLAADIVTAPHHGVESAAPNEFLEKVGAKVMLVSNSTHHWEGERGERMRRFAAERGIPTYVTGLYGNVIVTLMRRDFTIDSSREPPR